MSVRAKRPRLVISLPLSTGPGSTLHFHHCRLCYRAVLLRFFRTINCTVIEREAAIVGEREKMCCTPLKHWSLLVKTLGIDTVCVCTLVIYRMCWEGCAKFLFTENISWFPAANAIKRAYWWNSGYSGKIGCYLRFVFQRAFTNIIF